MVEGHLKNIQIQFIAISNNENKHLFFKMEKMSPL